MYNHLFFHSRYLFCFFVRFSLSLKTCFSIRYMKRVMIKIKKTSQCFTNLCLQLTVTWKLVEKLIMPKQLKASSAEKKSTEGLKWSFAAGTNLLPNFGAKIERESKLRLNDFAKELRAFNIVDMSGTIKLIPYECFNIPCILIHPLQSSQYLNLVLFGRS